MPVVSTTFVTVLQMLLKISPSHFIDEHDGRNDAKASIGGNFSMLFSSALSILVMAPSRFAAPRASINEWLALYDSDDGVVIVHQVTPWNVAQPKANLSAFPCSALGDECIAVSVLSHKGGVDE